MGDLNLFVPQWQGGGDRALYTGAAAARKGLNLKSRLTEIRIDAKEALEEENGIIGYRQIVRQLGELHDKIEETNPGSIFTLGGGCDVEIPVVSYLNKRYEGDLSVIWLDAHGDLNSPGSSKSRLFHGMPLRFLLEEGMDAGIDALCFSKLKPEQLLMVGGRDLDPPEKEYIEEKGIRCLSAEDVIWSDPAEWIGTLKTNLYVHIDLDVLDGKKFPYTLCPADYGLQLQHLEVIVNKLQTERKITGLSLLEYSSSDPAGSQGLKQIAAVGLWI